MWLCTARIILVLALFASESQQTSLHRHSSVKKVSEQNDYQYRTEYFVQQVCFDPQFSPIPVPSSIP